MYRITWHRVSTTREEECEQALALIQKDHPRYDFLADVPETIIETYKEKLYEKVYQRALLCHVKTTEP